MLIWQSTAAVRTPPSNVKAATWIGMGGGFLRVTGPDASTWTTRTGPTNPAARKVEIECKGDSWRKTRRPEPGGLVVVALLLQAEANRRRRSALCSIPSTSRWAEHRHKRFGTVTAGRAICLHSAHRLTGTGVSLWSRRSLRSLRPLRPLRSLLARDALNALRALRARRPLSPSISLRSRVSAASSEQQRCTERDRNQRPPHLVLHVSHRGH